MVYLNYVLVYGFLPFPQVIKSSAQSTGRSRGSKSALLSHEKLMENNNQVRRTKQIKFCPKKTNMTVLYCKKQNKSRTKPVINVYKLFQGNKYNDSPPHSHNIYPVSIYSSMPEDTHNKIYY